LAVTEVRTIGLFRALLTAHGQMMWNRTKKGLGRRGLVGMVVVVLVLLLGALPLFATFGFLGYLFGRGLDQPLAPPLMGAVLTASALGFGVIGGMLGGARQLTWDAYRSFPVTFRTLFFAETFASLGDLVVLGFIGVMTAMGVAFSWESPALSPMVVILLAEVVLWVLFLQHLVGALAVSAVRRLRRAMVVLVVAAWAGVSVVAGAAREVRDDLQGAQLERLRDLWHHARPLVNALPPVYAVKGMNEARRGAFVDALMLQLPMLGATLLLGAVSYALLRREASPRGAQPRAVATRRVFDGKRLSPRWAMAGLHFHHVAGSVQGRFGLVVPLITVVLVKGPLGAAGIAPDLTLPGSVIYLALAATQFHFNQFGFDGQGVKTLFLLPIPMREILVGKSFALLAYSALQNLFLLLLLGFVLRPDPRDALAAALLAGCLAVAHVLEGHWISAMYPRPLAMHRMNASGLSGANLLPLGVGMVNGALFGGIYALASWWKPEARVNVLLALLLVVVAVYRLALPRASGFVTSRRENVVEVLG